jgi:hypothetical protein
MSKEVLALIGAPLSVKFLLCFSCLKCFSCSHVPLTVVPTFKPILPNNLKWPNQASPIPSTRCFEDKAVKLLVSSYFCCTKSYDENVIINISNFYFFNFCFGDDVGQREQLSSALANSNDVRSVPTGAANAAATIETENRNNVSQLIDGGQHFQDVTDEELAAK